MASLFTVPVPPTTDPRWVAIVTHGTTAPLKLLALKMMLSRVNFDIKRDPSPDNVAKKIDELAQFFVRNARMLDADTVTLFGS